MNIILFLIKKHVQFYSLFHLLLAIQQTLHLLSVRIDLVKFSLPNIIIHHRKQTQISPTIDHFPVWNFPHSSSLVEHLSNVFKVFSLPRTLKQDGNRAHGCTHLQQEALLNKQSSENSLE